MTSKQDTPTWQHEAFTGMHSHEHPDNGVQGSTLHDHRHAHDGAASHKHEHPGARPVGAPSRDIGKSLTVDTPALDIVSGSHSLSDGLTKLQRSGRLNEAARELAAVAKAAETLAGTSKAALYERKARAASDPVDRQAYTELARQLRAEAGMS